MSDEKIHRATQEILEVLRRHDLSAFFTIQGRKLCETRWRFATWSCFEQTAHPEGSLIRFRTRKGGTGERRPEKDVADSANIARSFAESLAEAGMSAIGTWKELEKVLDAEGDSTFLGPPPPWDFK